MLEVTQNLVQDSLKSIRIKEGDGLLVHSAIQFLGRPEPGIGVFLDGIMDVLGTGGTIVVPTFTFDFPTAREFDPGETPSKEMGSFSEYVRKHPGSKRTLHPMQSVACYGYYAEDLANRDTASAFDPGSAYDRMLELDFKLLLLGADIQSVSILHYSEQRARVPYRYWKEFTGHVLAPRGWEIRTYLMYVRDLNIDPRLSLEPVQQYLIKEGMWHSVKLNYGQIASCRLGDFVSAVDSFLKSDPWSLVTNRPANN
jgi:aminoglycoside 3-N-acetyltransferase